VAANGLENSASVDRGVHLIDRLRKICLSLPGTSERLSHGEATFFINEKKSFVMSVNSHHGDGIVGLWCAAGPGEQQALIDEDPQLFFRPPYVGVRGWVGVRLDTDPPIDQARLTEIVEEAWSLVAPKTLLRAWEADREAGRAAGRAK
jgi:hypothetical protein